MTKPSGKIDEIWYISGPGDVRN